MMSCFYIKNFQRLKLSLCFREEVEDVLRLRAAVKEEAGVLEQQLSDLVHHYDDSIKMVQNYKIWFMCLSQTAELCLSSTCCCVSEAESTLGRTV